MIEKFIERRDSEKLRQLYTSRMAAWHNWRKMELYSHSHRKKVIERTVIKNIERGECIFGMVDIAKEATLALDKETKPVTAREAFYVTASSGIHGAIVCSNVELILGTKVDGPSETKLVGIYGCDNVVEVQNWMSKPKIYNRFENITRSAILGLLYTDLQSWIEWIEGSDPRNNVATSWVDELSEADLVRTEAIPKPKENPTMKPTTGPISKPKEPKEKQPSTPIEKKEIVARKKARTK
jgi:hypothetical protein